MVRYATGLLRGDLGGGNVQATVHLQGVGIDNLWSEGWQRPGATGQRHEQPRPWDVLFGHDHRVARAYHKHPFAYFPIELQGELYPKLQVRGGAVGAVGPKGVHGGGGEISRTEDGGRLKKSRVQHGALHVLNQRWMHT